ncbi:DHH family phosphoesterase [Exiguobacterium aurantiacum]|uniref:Cyclic-di-AMP phosphodiesterase n=1 Tax=Exiguobacterium aurantiacum TaxID=33987 RepID=A0ABY5FMU5_9BACL|nr:DHH family phosphoesterase [Exiguobacterium aurantiacum]UTT42939.1 DHH family phosphoesterase [Exiguobacterium aurantiacum]
MKNQYARHAVPYVIGLLVAFGLAFYSIVAAITLFVGTLIFFIYQQVTIRRERKAWEQYVHSLSHRIEDVGKEALTGMPIGILVFDEARRISWFNEQSRLIFELEMELGISIDSIHSAFTELIEEEEDEATIEVGDRVYRVLYNKEYQTLYLFDMTDEAEIEQKYSETQTVIGVLYLDNYDEMSTAVDEQVRSEINRRVTVLLNQWAQKYHIYMRRTAADRFFLVMNERTLSELENNRFSILDEVREATKEHKIPLTLSIGIGCGETTLTELGNLSQSSLDLGLGRGGDQVVVKRHNGKVRFFGGKTNPTEKRTRVRARVISNSMRDLIRESSRVLIMGHKNPDMDSLGASIGIMKLAEFVGREAYVVIPAGETSVGIQRLVSEVENDEELYSRFLTEFEAQPLIDEQTLLVVVDTHRPSLVISRDILDRAERVVVIDHHRRGEEFIEDPVLVYMEPYASSTCELVTELIEYQAGTRKLSILEATSLLAGMVVDTKGFTLRTGSRTFDAASFLRIQGADTVLVQHFMRQDLDSYIEQSHILENTDIYSDGMAIAVASDDEVHHQVLIAQSADQLLNMEGVKASFVIAILPDGRTGISARSLGDVNVQVIMEMLDGGGHLTNAATQLNVSREQAKTLLQEAIDHYMTDETEGEDSE